jgi:hypothetical protein
MRRKKSNENIVAMNRASGAEGVNVDETSTAITPFNKDSTEKIIKFPEEFIKIIQYEIKKTYHNSDDFQRISFVSKALSTDNDVSRIYLQLIKVENEKDSEYSTIIATDGRRLHMAQIEQKIPAGYYNIMTKRDTITFQESVNLPDEFHYPNYQKVIPADKDLTKVCDLDLNETSLTKNIVKTGTISRQFAKIVKRAEQVMNIRYLDDLSKRTWELYISKDATHPVLCFKTDDEKKILAVVMPMNIDEDDE